MKSKEERFLDLVERVQACRKCPRMKGSTRVLGLGCGPLDAKVLFVGEAPGRLGADASNVPFHGDKAGHNFESLIEQVGITRYEAFVTNAVLCNPKDTSGNNATPSSTEMRNCSAFLREQIDLINPEVVVTLGATALKACAAIEDHGLELGSAVRTSQQWQKRQLLPLYHPGQRAMIHRSFANQLADYQFVAETVRRDGRRKRRTSPRGTPNGELAAVVNRIVTRRGALGYFALHKLYFLAEVAHLEAVGERMANAYVIRQKDGPYCVDLHVAKLRAMIPGLVVERSGTALVVRAQPDLDLEGKAILADTAISAIDRTLERYGDLTHTDLKRAVYMSSPMRQVLRKEKMLGANLFNAPILPYLPKGRS